MTTIEGKPEGRPGVWLVTPETACALVDALEGDSVHCFLGFIGADWSKDGFHRVAHEGGKRIGLVFPPNATMGHQLVMLDDDKRWSFDVGEIPESRMTGAQS